MGRSLKHAATARGARAVVLATGLAGLVAACGGGSVDPDRPLAGSATDAFQRALEAKENGNCDRAEPILQRLSRIGRGWELAQVHLADCLIEKGRDASGAEAEAAYAEALRWLRPAANSNESEAQLRLAGLYLDGVGVLRDPVEAAKWYLLSQKSAIEGINDVPQDIQARLDAVLGATQWEEARERVEAWAPVYQALNAPPPRAAEEAEPAERFIPNGGPGRRRP